MLKQDKNSDSVAQYISPIEIIEKRIFLIRNQKVMIDADLSDIYEVPTMRLNEQVKRNLDRFPEDHQFR